MTELSGPGGVFKLLNLINPGRCPDCGELSDKMWHFFPKEDDRFLSATSIVIGCEECANAESER